MNRINATSDHPASDTQDIPASNTPNIHRQHSSDRDNDEEGLSPVQRWRIQDAMMRSLNDTNSAGLLAMQELLRVGWEITGAGLVSRSERDGVDQDPMRGEEHGSDDDDDDDDERENEVMERLELMVGFVTIGADSMVYADLGFSQADEMLASVNAIREGIPTVRPHPHTVPSPSVNTPSRVGQGFSGRMTEQSDDDSESEMPRLISL